MNIKQLAVVSALTIASLGAATATAYADPAPAAPVYSAPGQVQVDLPAAIAGVKDNITNTATLGGYVGGATGLVGGCLLGAAAAGTVSAPAALLFGAGPLAGCVGGALLLGSGGALAGSSLAGLGSAAANYQQFITLLNAPPAPKK